MPEKRWKAQERRIGRLLGLARLKRHGEKAPDLAGDWLVVEVKDRQKFPMWLVGAVSGIKGKAREGQLPIVVLTGPRSPMDLVVMDLRDFRSWFVK